MTTLRLTQRGLQVTPTTGIIVFLNGSKPLSGSMNDMPKVMGGGKKMIFYRGNCAGARPFVFHTIERAIEAINQIPAASNNARFFIGNSLIGEMKSGALTMFEKPVKQLL